MNFNFKYYGEYDVSTLKSLIESNDLDWDGYTFRQTHRKGQQDTKTVPLIWGEDFNHVTKRKDFDIFETELNKISDYIKKINGDGRITTALLINLPKNKKILPHIDSGDEHFFKTNRIHIPIITNDMCQFTVSNEMIHMKEGQMWEINNSFKTHSVDNNGDTDRIHLLIDFQRTNKELI